MYGGQTGCWCGQIIHFQPQSPYVQYNTIQYNTIQYNTIQYNTIQYNTIQYNTIQYNTIRYDAMRCDAMRCDAMRCDAMRCDAMRCDAMRCDAMQYSAVADCNMSYQVEYFYYSVIHCTVLRKWVICHLSCLPSRILYYYRTNYDLRHKAIIRSQVDTARGHSGMWSDSGTVLLIRKTNTQHWENTELMHHAPGITIFTSHVYPTEGDRKHSTSFRPWMNSIIIRSILTENFDGLSPILKAYVGSQHSAW